MTTKASNQSRSRGENIREIAQTRRDGSSANPGTPGSVARGRATPAEAPRVYTIPDTVSVKDLAEQIGVSPIEVLKQLIKSGVMANINQVIDFDTAALVARNLGIEVRRAAPPAIEEAAQRIAQVEEEGALQVRPPVVTIMGHVDHGKTTLLDAIRRTNVAAREAGGITQHIGAYQVEIHGQKITFLDTPGHEAFTAMRARGAKVTDIAVLVVAADDGVMPQTVEAINHAKAAGVPIVVAINKIDKPDANPERVKHELAEHGLLIEQWGGDVVCVNVSAKRKEGIEDLLENILVVAEVAELKANPNRPAVGTVIEARLDKTRGPVATVLVQNGTLKQGDIVVAGETFGRVKAMFNDMGRRLKKAEPSMPVEILGLDGVPAAGDTFEVVPDERTARQRVQERQAAKAAAAIARARALSLDALYSQIKAGEVKELNIILKTDVQGSIDPIKTSLERLQDEKIKVRVLHAGAGTITESDVMLAMASKAIIIGFNTRPEPGARRMAEAEGVDIRLYQVIYELVDDIKKALAGMLEPKLVEVIEGHGEVRQVFRIGKREAVAGVYMQDGKAGRGWQVRVIRNGEVVHDGRVASLKRFKEDVREVAAGYECGVGIEGFYDFQQGDILEFYRKERAS